MGLSIAEHGSESRSGAPFMPAMKVDGFIAGPAPRGGWPIKPYSVSKYIPHQGSKEKARRQRRMGVFEFQNAA